MENTHKEERQRPYWHLDAKWIFGITTTIFLGLSLFTYTLKELTNRKNGVEIMTMALATMYSGGDIDKTTDIEAARQKADANGNFCPIPNADKLCVNVNDFAKLGARQARLDFFKKLAEPIYLNDYSSYTSDPAQAKKIEKDSSLLRIASARSNQIITNIFYVFAVLTLASTGLMIFFSHRIGKLVSAGIVTTFASLPGMAIFGFLSIINPPPRPAGSTENLGPLGQFSPLVGSVAPMIGKIAFKIYLTVYIVGIILLIAALISKIVLKVKKKRDV